MLYIFKPRRCQLILALLPLLLPSGLAAQVAFRQAVELAVRHSATTGLAPVAQDKTHELCTGVRSLDLLQMGLSSAHGVPRDSSAAPGETTLSTSNATTRQTFTQWVQSLAAQYAEAPRGVLMAPSRRLLSNPALCVAVTYAALQGLNFQIQLVYAQETAAQRLVSVEIRRVVARVDTPVALTRAKLLAARTQMWAASLELLAKELRGDLAELTGLPESQIEPVADSMPPLPDFFGVDAETRATITQLAAARTAAQLEYELARFGRMRIRGKTVTGAAALPDLLAAYVNEYERLDALLHANFEFMRGQLQLLDLSGKLQEWALGTSPPSALFAAAPARAARARASSANPSVRSIMITPALSSLAVGEMRQFSAIAVYSDGTAKDATLDATWRCSSNWRAIVSPTGLTTPLEPGQVTITATVDGVSQHWRITITPDEAHPLNPE